MMKIIVVDKEPKIVDTLIEMIRQRGNTGTQVIGASDGIEAMKKLDLFHADVMITDIQLPGMSGFDLIKEAKNRNLCKHFVVLTSFHDTFSLRQAIRCKVADYLFKPLNKAQLYNVIQELSLEMADQQLGNQLKTGQEDPARLHVSDHMLKIMHFIETHYTSDISLDQISQHVHLHPNYISALFKKELGVRFLHYLRTKRINKATELIGMHPDMSISQVSGEVGFENVRHFFNVFKKYCGMTPGQYRESTLKRRSKNIS